MEGHVEIPSVVGPHQWTTADGVRVPQTFASPRGALVYMTEYPTEKKKPYSHK